MSELFWLTEAQVERRRPFFPKSRGKPRLDDRRVLSGIICTLEDPCVALVNAWSTRECSLAYVRLR